MLSQYLSKNAIRDQLISTRPDQDLGLVVVIPAHDEESLIPSLESLQNCSIPKCTVEIIIVFNASEQSENRIIEANLKAEEVVNDWYNSLSNKSFQMHIIQENEMPAKHAGVGLARKIGMDEAVRRFQENDNKEGVIICFDADSLCVENYLQEVEKHFKEDKKTAACSIYYEHPISGDDFPKEIYDGIYWYELHLRYYKNGLKYANLPYAFHTIGSSMAVRVKDYCKQGGMNRRKAGEDFYFLQKFIDVGLLSELNTTKLIPSPRASHRVPFGTGRAIQEMLDKERMIEKSYAFESFKILKECFSNVHNWYDNSPNFHECLIHFMGEDLLNKKLKEIRKQSSTKELFLKRFFQWFNAFQVLKFIHFLRDEYVAMAPLKEELVKLLKEIGYKGIKSDQLEILREFDRNSTSSNKSDVDKLVD